MNKKKKNQFELVATYYDTESFEIEASSREEAEEKQVYLVAVDRVVTKLVAIEAESKKEAEEAVEVLLTSGEIDMDEYDTYNPDYDNVECVEILPEKIEDVSNPAGPVEIKTDAKGRRW